MLFCLIDIYLFLLLRTQRITFSRRLQLKQSEVIVQVYYVGNYT